MRDASDLPESGMQQIAAYKQPIYTALRAAYDSDANPLNADELLDLDELAESRAYLRVIWPLVTAATVSVSAAGTLKNHPLWDVYAKVTRRIEAIQKRLGPSRTDRMKAVEEDALDLEAELKE